MRTIKVGVIGVGALGKHHARLYRECPGVELVGIHDTNDTNANAVAAELGTRAFADVRSLADATDGLSVAVPTDLHYAVVKALLEQGKHVLVEKPIAQTVDQAQELVALALVRNLVLQVGHVERFNPVLQCLHQVPGDARFIEAHRLAPYPPPRPGLKPRGTEVSVVLDLMIHDIDVVLSLVNSEVVRVDAVGVPVLSETEDIANARLLFVNHCVANLTVSRVSPDRLRKIRVFKSLAYLSLDYQEHKGELAALSTKGIERRPILVHDGNALLAELADFVRCVRGTIESGVPVRPVVSGEDGLKALVVAEQILADIVRQAPDIPRPRPIDLSEILAAATSR